MILADLTGCSAFEGFPPETIEPDAELATLQPYFAPDILVRYDAMTDLRTRKQFRDGIVYARLRAYDINFKVFQKALASENAGFLVGSDLAVLGLNAAGAITGGVATKSILHAASGGIVGAQGAVSKDLFYQKTLPALIAAMQAQRLAARVPIEKGLAKLDAEYSLHQAIADLSAYDAAGSIPGAIAGIAKDAGLTAATAQAEIRFTRDAAFVGALPSARSIGERIAALNAAQTLALAKLMDPNMAQRRPELRALLKNLDPNGRRLADGAAAKRVLLRWQVSDDRDPASLKEWADALDIVERL